MLIAFGVVGVVLGPFDQGVVHPLPDILLLLIEHLIDALPREIDSSGLLIEAFDYFGVVVGPFVSDGGYAGHQLALHVFVDGLLLDVVVLG